MFRRLFRRKLSGSTPVPSWSSIGRVAGLPGRCRRLLAVMRQTMGIDLKMSGSRLPCRPPEIKEDRPLWGCDKKIRCDSFVPLSTFRPSLPASDLDRPHAGAKFSSYRRCGPSDAGDSFAGSVHDGDGWCRIQPDHYVQQTKCSWPREAWPNMHHAQTRLVSFPACTV